MPAEAGIQSSINLNILKALDSRFRGNDSSFLIATQPLRAGGLQGFSGEERRGAFFLIRKCAAKGPSIQIFMRLQGKSSGSA
jgi:hypothetical protein